MYFIVCKLSLNQVVFKVSLLYLLNTYSKQNQVLVYILDFRKKRRETRKAGDKKSRIQINFRQFWNCEMRGEWNSYLICLFLFEDLLCTQRYKTTAIIFALRIFFPLSNIMHKFHFIGIYADFHINTYIWEIMFLCQFPTQKLDNTRHKKLCG